MKPVESRLSKMPGVKLVTPGKIDGSGTRHHDALALEVQREGERDGISKSFSLRAKRGHSVQEYFVTIQAGFQMSWDTMERYCDEALHPSKSPAGHDYSSVASSAPPNAAFKTGEAQKLAKLEENAQLKTKAVRAKQREREVKEEKHLNKLARQLGNKEPRVDKDRKQYIRAQAEQHLGIEKGNRGKHAYGGHRRQIVSGTKPATEGA